MAAAIQDEQGSTWEVILRRLRRDVVPRTVSLRATPNDGLRSDGNGVWSVVGPEPFFDLQPESGSLPCKWCFLDLELQRVDSGDPLRASFCADTGDGFSEFDRFQLRQPIQLPNIVRGLRLDPGADAGRFCLGAIRVTEIGQVRAAMNLLRPRIQPALDHPAAAPAMVRSAIKSWRDGGLENFKYALRSRPRLPPDDEYAAWILEFDTLRPADRRQIRERIEQLPTRPLISVVMLPGDVPEQLRRHSIESLRKQLYPNWEVTTLEAAKGEFVALLNPGDELAEHALYIIAQEIADHPDANLIYSDEDSIDANGHRVDPLFKPDWNPELLWSENYVGNFVVFRASLLREIVGLQSETYELCLRAGARTKADRIRHIPHVLSHSRGEPSPGSRCSPALSRFAGEGQKGDPTLALEEGEGGEHREPGEGSPHLRVVSDFLREQHIVAEVLPGPLPATSRVKLALPEPRPKVSLIIPTRDGLEMIRGCVTSLRKCTDYAPYEIVVVDNQSRDPQTLAYLDSLESSGHARVLRYDKPFNYSAINNWAVAQTDGEIVGLLNNDLEFIEPGWLSEMVSHAVRPDVGAVGAKLLYPDNTVQHAGVVGGIDGVAAHVFRGLPHDHPGYAHRARLLQEVSIVTAACLIIRREAYLKVGGLDEGMAVDFNDVDFCLRLRAAGYRNIWTPFALLYHLESATRGRDASPAHRRRIKQAIEQMRQKWGEVLMHDPFYNSNLALDSTRMELAFPSRAVKPWRGPR